MQEEKRLGYSKFTKVYETLQSDGRSKVKLSTGKLGSVPFVSPNSEIARIQYDDIWTIERLLTRNVQYKLY